MIEYSDFNLTPAQIKHLKEINARKSIQKYIKENGSAPSDTSSFYTVTPEDLERHRRLQYSIYLTKYQRSPFKSIEKICDYLYKAECREVDYNFAFDYFKINDVPVSGACSSIRSGNYFGRNFDWYYNHDIAMVIHTPRLNGRYASIGMAGCQPYLTGEMVEAGTFSEYLKAYPFFLLDGINEKGVFVNDNVVPGQDMDCTTTGTTPLEDKKGDLCMNMLPRFVLDNYASAREAIDDIRNHWSVYMKPSELLGHYEVHYMIGDPNETYIVEFYNNEMYVEKTDTDGGKLAVMTNFYIKGINLIDGKIGNVGENLSGLTPNGSGVDRYNILVDAYESAAESKDAMMEAMESVWYSKAYDRNNHWYSEFVGSPDRIADPDGSVLLTMNDPAEKYENVLNIIDGWYDNRNRDEWKVWHTTHTSVYDIRNRRLHLRFQENEIEDKEYVFEISSPFGQWGNEDGKDY